MPYKLTNTRPVRLNLEPVSVKAIPIVSYFELRMEYD